MQRRFVKRRRRVTRKLKQHHICILMQPEISQRALIHSKRRQFAHEKHIGRLIWW